MENMVVLFLEAMDAPAAVEQGIEEGKGLLFAREGCILSAEVKG